MISTLQPQIGGSAPAASQDQQSCAPDMAPTAPPIMNYGSPDGSGQLDGIAGGDGTRFVRLLHTVSVREALQACGGNARTAAIMGVGGGVSKLDDASIAAEKAKFAAGGALMSSYSMSAENGDGRSDKHGKAYRKALLRVFEQMEHAGERGGWRLLLRALLEESGRAADYEDTPHSALHGLVLPDPCPPSPVKTVTPLFATVLKAANTVPPGDKILGTGNVRLRRAQAAQRRARVMKRKAAKMPKTANWYRWTDGDWKLWREARMATAAVSGAASGVEYETPPLRAAAAAATSSSHSTRMRVRTICINSGETAFDAALVPGHVTACAATAAVASVPSPSPAVLGMASKLPSAADSASHEKDGETNAEHTFHSLQRQHIRVASSGSTGRKRHARLSQIVHMPEVDTKHRRARQEEWTSKNASTPGEQRMFSGTCWHPALVGLDPLTSMAAMLSALPTASLHADSHRSVGQVVDYVGEEQEDDIIATLTLPSGKHDHIRGKSCVGNASNIIRLGNSDARVSVKKRDTAESLKRDYASRISRANAVAWLEQKKIRRYHRSVITGAGGVGVRLDPAAFESARQREFNDGVNQRCITLADGRKYLRSRDVQFHGAIADTVNFQSGGTFRRFVAHRRLAEQLDHAVKLGRSASSVASKKTRSGAAVSSRGEAAGVGGGVDNSEDSATAQAYERRRRQRKRQKLFERRKAAAAARMRIGNQAGPAHGGSAATASQLNASSGAVVLQNVSMVFHNAVALQVADHPEYAISGRQEHLLHKRFLGFALEDPSGMFRVSKLSFRSLLAAALSDAGHNSGGVDDQAQVDMDQFDDSVQESVHRVNGSFLQPKLLNRIWLAINSRMRLDLEWEDWLSTVLLLARGKIAALATFCFHVFDFDNDGYINMVDLFTALQCGADVHFPEDFRTLCRLLTDKYVVRLGCSPRCGTVPDAPRVSVEELVSVQEACGIPNDLPMSILAAFQLKRSKRHALKEDKVHTSATARASTTSPPVSPSSVENSPSTKLVATAANGSRASHTVVDSTDTECKNAADGASFAGAETAGRHEGDAVMMDATSRTGGDDSEMAPGGLRPQLRIGIPPVQLCQQTETVSHFATLKSASDVRVDEMMSRLYALARSHALYASHFFTVVMHYLLRAVNQLKKLKSDANVRLLEQNGAGNVPLQAAKLVQKPPSTPTSFSLISSGHRSTFVSPSATNSPLSGGYGKSPMSPRLMFPRAPTPHTATRNVGAKKGMRAKRNTAIPGIKEIRGVVAFLWHGLRLSKCAGDPVAGVAALRRLEVGLKGGVKECASLFFGLVGGGGGTVRMESLLRAHDDTRSLVVRADLRAALDLCAAKLADHARKVKRRRELLARLGRHNGEGAASSLPRRISPVLTFSEFARPWMSNDRLCGTLEVLRLPFYLQSHENDDNKLRLTDVEGDKDHLSLQMQMNGGTCDRAIPFPVGSKEHRKVRAEVAKAIMAGGRAKQSRRFSLSKAMDRAAGVDVRDNDVYLPVLM